MRKWYAVLALILSACMAFSACSSALQTQTQTEVTAATEPVSTDEIIETGVTTEEGEKVIDYENLKELKVLLVGNSFCYYWVDELMNFASEAGIKLTVGRVYHSGCTFEMHMESYKKSDFYEFTVFSPTDSGFGYKMSPVKTTNLITCLQADKWDVVSMQQHFAPNVSHDYDLALDKAEPYGTLLYDLLHNYCPNAKYVFHQIWSYQVGFPTTTADIHSGTPVPDKAYQTVCYENIKKVAEYYGDKFGIDIVPSGDAWQAARQDPAVGDVMCKPDYYHDGEEGGGQFLNACVWFEMLFHKDCRVLTTRPIYELSDARVEALQRCAHEAVLARYGEDFYVD